MRPAPSQVQQCDKDHEGNEKGQDTHALEKHLEILKSLITVGYGHDGEYVQVCPAFSRNWQRVYKINPLCKSEFERLDNELLRTRTQTFKTVFNPFMYEREQQRHVEKILSEHVDLGMLVPIT